MAMLHRQAPERNRSAKLLPARGGQVHDDPSAPS